jgi:pimeloyl-ACP methyl ester carboxylesterase
VRRATPGVAAGLTRAGNAPGPAGVQAGLKALAYILGAALVIGQSADRLVNIGEHRLFLSCSGTPGNGPTVILEAGGGGTSAEWSAVREQLAPTVRTCAYDRAGSGRSDVGPKPRTLRQETFELHALLQAAGEKPPFVMAGQSLGGLLVRLYAAAHPADVVGIVLVDPTHESGVLGSSRYGGFARLREKAAGLPVPEPRRSIGGEPPADPAADYLAEEFQQIHLARQRTLRTLGDRPLVVLAAGKRPAPPPGVADELWKTLRDERDVQVQDLAELSTAPRPRHAPGQSGAGRAGDPRRPRRGCARHPPRADRAVDHGPARAPTRLC